MPQILHALIVAETIPEAELLLQELRRSDFNPKGMVVGTEAEYLTHLRAGLDVVIVGLGNSGFDGFRALELCRQREVAVPFVFVSNRPGEDLAVAAMKLGATDYLLKERLAQLGPIVRAILSKNRPAGHSTGGLHPDGNSPVSTANLIHSPSAEVMVLDHEAHIAAVNEAWERGHRSPGGAEFLGQPYQIACAHRWQKLDERDVRAAEEGIRRVLAGESADFKLEYHFPSPTDPRWFLMQVSPRGDSSQGAVVINENITQRKRAVAALWRKTLQVELAVRGARMGVWEWDFASDIITILESTGPISGLPENLRPITGEALFARVHPEDREMVSRYFKRSVLGRAEYQVEFRIVLPADTIRWVAARGQCVYNEEKQPVSLTAVDIDITERKEIERDFRERAVLAQLSSTVGIAVTRAADLPGGLELSVRAIVETMEAALVRIWLRDETTESLELELVASAGEHSQLNESLNRIPIDDGKIGQIARERRPLVTNEVMGNARVGDQEWAQREGVVAFAGYPLIAADRVIGVLALYARRPLTDSEFKGLEELALILALFINQRRATDGRLEQQLHLAGIIDSSLDAIIGTDASDKILLFNRAAEAMFGWSAADALGRSAECLLPERFRSPPPGSGPRTWGSRGMRANGEEFPVEAALTEIQVAGQKLATVILRDLTERQRSELRIRQLNRGCAVLSDYIQAMVQSSDSRTIFDKVCRIAHEKGGFGLAWIGLADPDSKRIEPVAQAGEVGYYLKRLNLRLDDDAEVVGPTVAAFRTSAPVVCNDIEHEVLMSPWRVDSLFLGFRACAAFPLVVGGRTIGTLNLYADEVGFFDEHELQLLAALAMNIAFTVKLSRWQLERRPVEDELRWKTVFLQALVDAAPDAILVLDPQGTNILQNRRMAELLKISGSSVSSRVGVTPLQQIAELAKQPAEIAARFAYVTDHPNEASRDEVELLEGTILEGTSLPVCNQAGVQFGRIWTFRDLTERRKLEHQLAQVQKMEALGTLTGGLAHDFNNIFAAIIGYAELAKMRVKDNPTVAEYLTAVLQGGARAVELVRHIQNFSKATDQQRKPVQLRQVLAEPIKLLRASIPSSVEFKLALATDLPMVWADAAQIHRVTMSLCTSAWHRLKNSPGCLQVVLENVNVDAPFVAAHPGLRLGRYVRLVVSATARGATPIAPEMAVVPIPTSPGSAPAEVEDAGLSMVHDLVRSHDGIVIVSRLPGGEPLAQLYFPADAPEVFGTPVSPNDVPGGKGERILFVDDEKPLALLGKKMLEELGYVVECSTNVVEALAVVRRQPDAFKLVVTDLTMPGMTGTDFARQLRQIRPSLPIILTTGYNANLTTERVRELGICELLPKPHTVHSLSAAVHRALAKSTGK